MLARFLILLFGLTLCPVVRSADSAPDIFAKFRPSHPRLLARSIDWESLRNRMGRDRLLAAYVASLQREALAITEESPVTYKMIGKGFPSGSRESLRRITTLAFCQRIQPNPAFLAHAIREMEALANFPDWNPSHFLDTAEVAAAMGIGYDWLYDQLPLSTRELVRRAIVEKALKSAAGDQPWYRSETNWNQVCIGGLTIAALAVAEDEPELARNMVDLALLNNHAGLRTYAPDGIYPEGTAYWSYGTAYQVLLIASLESALGSDFGLPASPGFMASPGVHTMLHGPTGLPFNFSDGPGLASFEPTLFWFSQKLKNPGLLSLNAEHLKAYLKAGSKENPGDPFASFAAFWWPETLAFPAPSLPLRWSGDGKTPVALFRESWTDPKALYLATKGGSASVNHGHMDVGSFVLEADGVRWARDLEAQDGNSLESKRNESKGNEFRGNDFSRRRQNPDRSSASDRSSVSDRWSAYELNNHSHNTLTINGKLHRQDGRATISRFSADPAASLAVLDLTAAFRDQATKVTRGFRLLPGRTVLIQDELAGLKPDDTVRWAMVTSAQIEVNGNEATLTENGQTLRARIIAPAGASFAVSPAHAPSKTDAKEEGEKGEDEKDVTLNATPSAFRVLTVETKAPASGIIGQVILLRPGAAPFDPATLPKPTSIIRW